MIERELSRRSAVSTRSGPGTSISTSIRSKRLSVFADAPRPRGACFSVKQTVQDYAWVTLPLSPTGAGEREPYLRSGVQGHQLLAELARVAVERGRRDHFLLVAGGLGAHVGQVLVLRRQRGGQV